jgi:hypothetical protein
LLSLILWEIRSPKTSHPSPFVTKPQKQMVIRILQVRRVVPAVVRGLHSTSKSLILPYKS